MSKEHFPMIAYKLGEASYMIGRRGGSVWVLFDTETGNTNALLDATTGPTVGGFCERVHTIPTRVMEAAMGVRQFREAEESFDKLDRERAVREFERRTFEAEITPVEDDDDGG
jgi:hypothetical protein